MPSSSSSSIALCFSNRNLSHFSAENILSLSEEEELVIEPRQLKSLDLSHNHLMNNNNNASSSTVSLSHPLFSWLESLDLSHNNLKTLHGIAFPPQLRKLDLSHNFLQASEIGHRIKNSCRFLISLKLNHNALANSIARDNIAFPRELASLDVSHNGITSFGGVLNGLSHLHTLRSHNNDLENVEDVIEQLTSLSKFNQLRYLHLDENPILSSLSYDEGRIRQVRNKIVLSCESIRTLDGVPVQGRESYHQPQTENTDNNLSNNIQDYSSPIKNNNSNTSRSSVTNQLSPTNNNSIPFSGESPNSGAAARDDRRKCQALRQILQNEMKQEASLKTEVELLKKQLQQQDSLQRSQLQSVVQLTKEKQMNELEKEKLKTEIAENSLAFLECHAETKQRRMGY